MACFWDDPSMILGCFWHVPKKVYPYFGKIVGMFRETIFFPKTRVTLLLHSFLHGRYTTISTSNPIEHRSNGHVDYRGRALGRGGQERKAV